MQPDIIVGAGLTGLLAAHAWPRATVIEQMPEPKETHRALLRFRSDAVARLTGAEFKKVRVRKGIWFEGMYREPDILLANMYSKKIMPPKLLSDRSIWNLDPVDRYVAPDTFYNEMLDAVEKRIQWGQKWIFPQNSISVSTIPLPVVIGDEGVNDYDPHAPFERAAISVSRYYVPECDLYQTVYFPTAEHSIYRASITGHTLICEHAAHIHDIDITTIGAPHKETIGLREVMMAFNLDSIRHQQTVEQRYGKIAPIDEATRRELLFRLTHDYKIYSLGRFATWRNILLDDVVNDIDVIKRLMRSGDNYELKRSL